MLTPTRPYSATPCGTLEGIFIQTATLTNKHTLYLKLDLLPLQYSVSRDSEFCGVTAKRRWARLLWNPWYSCSETDFPGACVLYLHATFLSVVMKLCMFIFNLKCLFYLSTSTWPLWIYIFYSSLPPFWFLDFYLIIMALKNPCCWVTTYLC